MERTEMSEWKTRLRPLFKTVGRNVGERDWKGQSFIETFQKIDAAGVITHELWKKWMQAKEYHASPNDFPESSNYRYKRLLFKFMYLSGESGMIYKNKTS